MYFVCSHVTWNWVVCMEIDDFSHYILIWILRVTAAKLYRAESSSSVQAWSNRAGARFKTSSIEPNRALTLKHQTESSRPLSLIRPIRADPSARIVWIDCHLWTCSDKAQWDSSGLFGQRSSLPDICIRHFKMSPPGFSRYEQIPSTTFMPLEHSAWHHSWRKPCHRAQHPPSLYVRFGHSILWNISVAINWIERLCFTLLPDTLTRL